MKQRIALVALVLVLIGGYLWWQGRPADGSILYGNVDIRDVNLAFRVGGRVSEVLVDEGDAVQAGQLLARLDPAPLIHSRDSARANLAALTAANALMHKGYRSEETDRARASLSAAEAAALEADKQWRRQSALAATGAISRGQLDTARSQRDQTRAQVRAAREQLALLETGYRPEEIAQSDAQLEGAKAALASAELALADAALTAPSDGILLTRAVETGSMVQAGATAFNLSLTTPVWVRAYVEEPWLGHFPSGARVQLTTDSRPDQPYQGVVGFVSPSAEFTPKSVETPDLRTHLVYRLRIVVQDPDPALRQGMPVTVRLAP
ncbi:secretion protein HlyD [Aeromonas taiwanensis]|uniref:Secretion protein HlyD n=1 Tax=Aeromonas taiwanensis TaxID=633417 RepID=A0A5F0KGT1_9GAMM|nr:secretion protein HlyD [Aeromonas taiwanensis]TFF81290.1 secretion protein HlyD [Aeromonas taiwanensis]TFF82234.1 secretion protein HlyD [Aeromonas taiwanensis]TFF83545.1 secretion protein HlyD [Aeromonas taiwanensis]